MGMLLTSNSTTNALVSPDGFNPPFSLEGCEYIGLYDKDPTINFAPGKASAQVIGNPTRDGVGLKTKSSVDYIDTMVVPGQGDLTIIAVVDKASATPKVGDTGGRVWLVSSYSGLAGSDVGTSLSMGGLDANGKPININHYRSISTTGVPNREVIQSPGSIQGSPDFGIYVGKSWKEGTAVRSQVINLRNEGSASNTVDNKMLAQTTATMKVGSAVSTTPDPLGPTVTVYCVMIFKRNVPTEELRTMRSWVYDYYRRRGISGI